MATKRDMRNLYRPITSGCQVSMTLEQAAHSFCLPVGRHRLCQMTPDEATMRARQNVIAISKFVPPIHQIHTRRPIADVDANALKQSNWAPTHANCHRAEVPNHRVNRWGGPVSQTGCCRRRPIHIPSHTERPLIISSVWLDQLKTLSPLRS